MFRWQASRRRSSAGTWQGCHRRGAQWRATLARRGGPLGFALLGSGPWRSLFSSSTDCSPLAWSRAHSFQASSGRRGRLDGSHQCRQGARRPWQARAKVEARLQLEVHLERAPFSPTQTPPMPSRRKPLALRHGTTAGHSRRLVPLQDTCVEPPPCPPVPPQATRAAPCVCRTLAPRPRAVEERKACT